MHRETLGQLNRLAEHRTTMAQAELARGNHKLARLERELDDARKAVSDFELLIDGASLFDNSESRKFEVADLEAHLRQFVRIQRYRKKEIRNLKQEIEDYTRKIELAEQEINQLRGRVLEHERKKLKYDALLSALSDNGVGDE